MRGLFKYLTSLIMLMAATQVHAVDISMRGYASIVAGQAFDDEQVVEGYEDNLDLKPESLAALQFNAEVSENLSATIQMLARGRDDYDAGVEWAYLTYEFSDSLQLSAGRIRAPFYRYSDFYDVRYAIPWVSVPSTVYSFDFPGYDGFSLVKTNTFGSWDSSLQVVYGKVDGELPDSETSILIEGLVGFSWTMTRDWLNLQLGYMTSQTTIGIPEFDQLAAQVQATGDATSTDVTALVDNIVIEKDRGEFLGAAIGIDYNDWLVNAEYVTFSVDDSLLAETEAYYIMLGKRIGAFTPNLTISNSSGEPSDDIFANVPPGPIADNFNPVFSSIVNAEEETDLIIAGLRWDFQASAALKFEYLDATYGDEDSAGLFRIALDVVF